MSKEQTDEEVGGGILLYYKYVGLGEDDRRAVVKDWYLQHCGDEGLRGRYICNICTQQAQAVVLLHCTEVGVVLGEGRDPNKQLEACEWRTRVWYIQQ